MPDTLVSAIDTAPPTSADYVLGATAAGFFKRFAKDSLGPFVNVKDPQFGAVGDGVTDDMAAIVAALAALEAAGGGILFFPLGTYLLLSSVSVTADNITLFGCRGCSVIKAGGSGDAPIYLQGSNQEIAGLKFLGDQSGGASSRQGLIYIGGSGKTPARIRIHNNYFQDASSSCIIFGTDGSTCSDIHIHHNEMVNFWECGVDSVGAASNVFIHHNIMRSNTVHPNAAVSRPIGVGFECQVNNAVIDGWNVTDNEIDFSAISVPDRNTSHGISFGKPSTPPANAVLKRGLIARNTINGVGQGLRITDTRWGTNSYGVNLTVTDNTLTSCRDHAMYLRGGEDATHQDVVICTGNTIKGFSEFSTNSRDGILLDLNWYEPIVSDNWISRRVAESGAVNGRYGVNIAAATVLRARIAGNRPSFCTSGPYADTSLTASIDHPRSNVDNTNAAMNANETFTVSSARSLVRNPNATRNLDPSGVFYNGFEITVMNIAAAQTITFDSTGIAQAITGGQSCVFVYDGKATVPTWRKVFIG